jgi:hypothetical protein
MNQRFNGYIVNLHICIYSFKCYSQHITFAVTRYRKTKGPSATALVLWIVVLIVTISIAPRFFARARRSSDERVSIHTYVTRANQ